MQPGEVNHHQDLDEECLVDENICSNEELERTFQKKFKLTDERAIALNKDYVLKLCADDSFSRVVAGISDASLQIFDLQSQTNLRRIEAPVCKGDRVATVCGVRFLDASPYMLLVGTTDGSVSLFDLRTLAKVAVYKNNLDCDFLCIDRNSNSRIISAGTSRVNQETYIVFYDLRKAEDLGVYCDSHSDDVTALHFHSTNPDLLCSGSTDGLVNIYDIREEDEDDALQQTFNTLNPVDKIKWHSDSRGNDFVSCITTSNDFIIYNSDSGDEIASFERKSITASIQRKCNSNCNAINAHSTADGTIFLMAGTFQNQGDVLRSVLFQNGNLVPYADLPHNKQIVRDSIYDVKSEILLAGGESGIITVWTPEESQNFPNTTKSLKIKSKHANKMAPY